MVHRGSSGRDCEGWCRAYDAAEAESVVCEDNDSMKCNVESVETTLSSDDSVKEGEAHAGQLKNNHLSELSADCRQKVWNFWTRWGFVGLLRQSCRVSLSLSFSLCWMAKSVVEMRTVVGEVAIRWTERFHRVATHPSRHDPARAKGGPSMSQHCADRFNR